MHETDLQEIRLLPSRLRVYGRINESSTSDYFNSRKMRRNKNTVRLRIFRATDHFFILGEYLGAPCFLASTLFGIFADAAQEDSHEVRSVSGIQVGIETQT